MLGYEGAENDLAKVGVEGSSPFARSRFFQRIQVRPGHRCEQDAV